ncbi:hypothetical protein A1O3_07198 [Capronia epimyces CBS 606.96]|uniref:N-acetyltransferase domain-containing protein n=1 Tax=Capronia epimyces CBS 606.96 TaxID=1182542 RepID=W9XUB1_9EURO|nr:uncharacterized protein A1O3_07198 [Capronia epimyces CBS 606.96]EXJ80910.1 hypothetical protein A1O3_07198 [Capronia epimyces CBS 606.96]
MPTPTWTWHRDNFEISTDPTLIPLDTLNEFLASDDMSWAKPLPFKELEAMVHRSVCFALYENDNNKDDNNDNNHPPPQPRPKKLIGLTRWITDGVTVVYLNDVYILQEYRGKRLANWMMECVDEVFNSMEHLRGMIMIVDKGSQAEALYRTHLSMDDLESPGILLDRKGKGSAY